VGPRLRHRSGQGGLGLGLYHDRLISLIDPANAASIAVATHLGETPRGEVDLWGHRVLVYAIDRAEWERRN
jgi:RimJ/RimL family protein N-acetyltransferase